MPKRFFDYCSSSDSSRSFDKLRFGWHKHMCRFLVPSEDRNHQRYFMWVKFYNHSIRVRQPKKDRSLLSILGLFFGFVNSIWNCCYLVHIRNILGKRKNETVIYFRGIPPPLIHVFLYEKLFRTLVYSVINSNLLHSQMKG